MDLALNNSQRLIWHKTQTQKNPSMGKIGLSENYVYVIVILDGI